MPEAVTAEAAARRPSPLTDTAARRELPPTPPLHASDWHLGTVPGKHRALFISQRSQIHPSGQAAQHKLGKTLLPAQLLSPQTPCTHTPPPLMGTHLRGGWHPFLPRLVREEQGIPRPGCPQAPTRSLHASALGSVAPRDTSLFAGENLLRTTHIQ